MENLKGKKIAILTAGSTGDVLPFVALAKELKARGACPVLSTGRSFQSLAETHEIDFVPIALDAREMLSDEGDQNKYTKNFFKHLNKQRKVIEPKLLQSYDIWWEIAKSADVLIYHPLVFCGLHIAEKLDIPAFMSAAVPVIAPTNEFLIPISGLKDFGFLNKISYKLATYLLIGFYSMTNKWRMQTLGLKSYGLFKDVTKCKGKALPILYSYSRELLPESLDWPDSVNVTGYWFLDHPESWQPPQALVEFLDAGESPIYIGFGSMPGTDSTKITSILQEVVGNSSYRFIIATGWGGIQTFEAGQNVFFIESVPHEWLFSKVSLIVHHGGSGTTGAALRSGKPAVICPFMLDQYFWSDLLHKKGLIEKPLPQKSLTSEKLMMTIEKTLKSEVIKEKILPLSNQIKNENGCKNAVLAISQFLE